jgi:hypothetical protein
MPLSFYSISTFRESKLALCKKEKDGYHSCLHDICETFKGLAFEDIWELQYRIRELDNIRIIKVRVQNSFQHLSSADGFRLILYCNRKYQSVTFLNIYPKRGKLAQIDQTPQEYKRQLKTYLLALKNKDLVGHDIENKLVELD